MYGWLWRHLPGPWFARIGELLVLLVGVLALLFYIVFPAADPHLPFNEVTVQQPSSPSPTITATTTTTVTESPSISYYPTGSPTATPTLSPTATPTPTSTGSLVPGGE